MSTRTSEETGKLPFYGRYSHVKLKAHQANERTLIGCVCAALLIMFCSVPAAQYSREIDSNSVVQTFLSIKPFQTSSLLGLSSLICGVVVAILSCFRYVRVRANVEEGIYRGPDFFHLAFLGAILFASLFLGLYLMEMRGIHWVTRSDSSTSEQLGVVQSRLSFVPVLVHTGN
jgi:uncharacterized membrane protein YidH (DUF202 family)